MRNYWNYYLELESEFVQTKRFVEFSINNYNSFSIEYLKLYQAICSEIDVLGKYIASLVNNDISRKNCKNIQKWWIKIQDLSLYLDITKIDNPYVKPVLISEAKVHNYIINEDYQPWKDYRLEISADKKCYSRVKLSTGSSTPKWWINYNNVKHHRTEINDLGLINFQNANLKNVCESFSALYILELLVLNLSVSCKKKYESIFDDSKLFTKTSL